MSYTPALNTILLGAPKAPTATAGDNSERISTTSFVQSTVDTAIDDALAAGDFVGRTTTQTITGAKTFSAATVFNGTTTYADNLHLNGVAMNVNAGSNIRLVADSDLRIAGTSNFGGFQTSVTGDIGQRFEIKTQGELAWGNGGGTTDLYLNRVGASTLGISGTGGDGFIVASGTPTLSSHLTNKGYVDGLIDDAVGGIDFSNFVTLDTQQIITATKTFTAFQNFHAYLNLEDAAYLMAEKSTGGHALIQSRVDGDLGNRFRLNTDGELQWGAGAGSTDTILSRFAAGVIGAGNGNQIRVNVAPTDGYHLANKNYVDFAISDIDYSNFVTLNTDQTIDSVKTFTDHITMDGIGAYLELINGSNIYVEGTMAGAQAFASAVAGDLGDNRLIINAGGLIQWGPGDDLVDTNLYRFSEGLLRTDGDFWVGQGLTVAGTGGISIGAAGDAILTRTGAGVIGVTGKIQQAAVPTQNDDLVNKAYVDAQSQGLDQKASVRAASTSNLDLTGLETVDGVTLVAGDRVLVMGQTAPQDNGIYIVAAGAWSRSEDANTDADVTAGMFTFVSEGTDNGSNGFVLITPDPVVLGTTELEFTQFSKAGEITAGDGLIKTGNVIDVQGTINRIAVNVDNIDIDTNYAGQASIDTLGTITTGTWNAGVIDIAYGGTGANSLAGAQSNLDIVTLTDAQTISGIKTFTSSTVFDWYTIHNNDIQVENGKKILVQGGASGVDVLWTNATGDSGFAPRFAADNNGVLRWGTGAATPDITLGRGGAGELIVGGNVIANDATAAGHLVTLQQLNAAVGGVDLSDYVTLDTAQDITGQKNFTEQLTLMAPGGSGSIYMENLTNGANIGIDVGSGLYMQLANNGWAANWSVIGDGGDRIAFNLADSGIHFGDGTGSVDTLIRRGGVGKLTSEADLAFYNNGFDTVENMVITKSGSIKWGNGIDVPGATELAQSGTGQLSIYGDIGLYIDASLALGDGLGVPSEIVIRNENAGDMAFRIITDNDTWPKYSFTSEGEHMWGNGTVEGGDVSISRAEAGVLFVGGKVQASDATAANHLVTLGQLNDAVDLTNYVTLDTTQTITGGKAFDGGITIYQNSFSMNDGFVQLDASPLYARAVGTGTQVFGAGVINDPNGDALTILSDGTLSWFNGTDTTTLGQVAGQLNTNDDLVVQGNLITFGQLSVDLQASFYDHLVVNDKNIKFDNMFTDASVILRADVAGEGNDRFTVQAGGRLQWGPGTTATDIVLERTAANVLQLGAGDTLRVQQDPSNANDVVRKSYVDAAVGGSTALTTTTILDDTVLTGTEKVVLVNHTGNGPVTITLPATHTNGQVIHIKDISGLAETDNITIDTSDADVIDNQNTASIVMNYQTISVVSNGTNWYII